MPRSARPGPEPDAETPDHTTGAPEVDGTSGTTPPASPPPGSAAPPPSGSRFFGWLRGLDLRREPGWIGGVCAGIAVRLGIDPLIVRGIVVVIAVLGGPAILLYALAWLMVPDAQNRIHLEDVFRGRFEPVIAVIGGLIALSMLPLAQGFWFLGAGFWGVPDWGGSVARTIWTLVVIGAVVALVVWIARRQNGVPPAATGAAQPSASADPGAAHATAGSATSGATPQNASAFVGEPVTAPSADASADEVAAWRAQQEQVRAEQRAFRDQQAQDRAAANREAAAQAQAVRAANHEAQRARYAASRSHPLYSIVAIGLSLVAGGLTVLALSGVEPTGAAIIVGVAVALGVLGFAIIVNGIRGKRAGGAAGVAWLLLIPLAFSGVAVAAGDTAVRWGPVGTLQPTESESFAVGAGRVELDLTEFASASAELPADVVLRIGAGEVTVVVPDDVPIVFSATVGAGAIDAQAPSSRVGPVQTVNTVYNPDPNNKEPLVVSVQLGAGYIRVVGEGARP